MKFLYYFIQFTWGILQNAAGFLWFLRYLRRPHFLWHGAIVTRARRRKFRGGWTLGCFIFVTELPPDAERDILIHEYGHTIQCLILGPLWTLLIGLPSTLWCSLPCFRRLRQRKNIPYSRLYCEAWANRLGERITGEKLRGEIG